MERFCTIHLNEVREGKIIKKNFSRFVKVQHSEWDVRNTGRLKDDIITLSYDGRKKTLINGKTKDSMDPNVLDKMILHSSIEN